MLNKNKQTCYLLVWKSERLFIVQGLGQKVICFWCIWGKSQWLEKVGAQDRHSGKMIRHAALLSWVCVCVLVLVKFESGMLIKAWKYSMVAILIPNNFTLLQSKQQICNKFSLQQIIPHKTLYDTLCTIFHCFTVDNHTLGLTMICLINDMRNLANFSVSGGWAALKWPITVTPRSTGRFSTKQQKRVNKYL